MKLHVLLGITLATAISFTTHAQVAEADEWQQNENHLELNIVKKSLMPLKAGGELLLEATNELLDEESIIVLYDDKGDNRLITSVQQNSSRSLLIKLPNNVRPGVYYIQYISKTGITKSAPITVE